MVEKLTRPRAELEGLFEETVQNGEDIKESIWPSQDTGARNDLLVKVRQWNRKVQKLLNDAFAGPNAANSYPGGLDERYLTGAATIKRDFKRIEEALAVRLEALKSIAERLPLYEEPSATRVGSGHPASGSSTAIFIVHGRSEGPKLQVARFLETGTNSTPIILHEQAKRGRMIIESLEEYAATAAFVIILLTADDYGGLAGSSGSQPRARQNVVFELGLFIGALGRSRVAVLYEEAVELPSDMNGILYTVLDAQGAWKLSLGRELLAAGFAVDLNAAK